jgi:sugar (pentulose or hexulose) kinase
VSTEPHLDLTLVIDIGKSNAKLLMLDDAGEVVERHSRPNASVPSRLGYPALDLHGLEAWMASTLRSSEYAKRCGHVIASTHGAALVALTDSALAWDPVDYEFEGVSQADIGAIAFDAGADNFRDTLSPELPAGLNAARQLHWMQNRHPEAWRRTRCLVPYPQYWAWLLSGVASSEISSLGCHTHLWNPVLANFSSLAVAKGWASLFAPMRSAWEVLGPTQPKIASEWGLPAACQVHVGVHDSNACLARYFDSKPTGGSDSQALTVVSSGTWTVLMAPGAPVNALDAKRDMLGNADVTGQVTPTARFMGGREFAVILDGADPQAASLDTLRHLIDRKTFAFPSFSHQGGPFSDHVGAVERGGQCLDSASADRLSDAERATLAATYCAQVTAWLIHYLWAGTTKKTSKVIVEGPLSSSPVYMFVLQTLLPNSECVFSTDKLEGTARGAWILSRWGCEQRRPELASAKHGNLAGLKLYHQCWLDRVKLHSPA